MNVYFTREFAQDIKFNQYPINGFKCMLVRYPTNYDPAVDGIDQDLLFRGMSSLSNGFGWNGDNGLRVIYDLVDDPLAKSADTESEDSRYYHGVIFLYYRLIEGIDYPMRAFLVHDPYGELCKGVNALTLLGINDICLFDWTSNGLEHGAPSKKVFYNTWLKQDTKLLSIYKILHDYVDASTELSAELNYYQNLMSKYSINALIK